MLRVEIDKILPVTEARAKIASVVDDVAKGNIYVLTRGGKPIVAVAPIQYFDKVSQKQQKPTEPIAVTAKEKLPEVKYEKPQKLKLKPIEPKKLQLKKEEIEEIEPKKENENLPAGIDLDKVEKALAQVNYSSK